MCHQPNRSRQTSDDLVLIFLIRTNYSLSCLQVCSMTDAICLPGTALVPFAHNIISSANVSPGHQLDRKKS